MPRLFDLLSDDSKKELITEKRKKKPPHSTRDPKRTHLHKEPKPLFYIPDFVALDVETTGLNFKTDRIIEIGAIIFKKGKPVEEFSTFINPGIPVPPAITDLTGICDADLADAPDFSAIAEKLLLFINKMPLCGHQIEFDATFLKEEFKRLDKPATSNQLLDTALLSRILLDPRGRFSLKYVCDALNVSLDNAHRALHDAKASGEVAVRLIPKIPQLPLTVRQTIAVCTPSSIFKSLLFKTLQGAKPEIILDGTHEKPLQRLSCSDESQPIDRNDIEHVFSNEGRLSQQLKSFLPRKSQQDMAREVTDALNTQSLYIAEAGTGTGKSLAYLVPAAFWAMHNECRVIVSTRTRNLQDQLVTHDLPIVTTLTKGTLKTTVLKGRNNYLCIHRFEKLLKGTVGNLSPRERFAILPLVVWCNSTKTGDIEEQNQFNPKWFSKIWNTISAEHHECNHRRCPFFTACFFQRARNRALGSHIVIINHALFFSDICSETSFLGSVGPIIFDEAHHLESSGHRFLRVELDTNRVTLFTEIINNLVQRIGPLQEEKQIYEKGKTVRATLRQFRKLSGAFLTKLTVWAKERFAETPEYQTTCTEAMFEEFSETGAFLQVIIDLTDHLLELKQAIKAHPEADTFTSIESETQACIERTLQLKADFIYLLAAKTEEHVFWIEGNHRKGWNKLCGVPLDIGSLLSDIWERCNGAVIFTSATLSIAQSVDYFKRSVGLLSHEARTASSLFKSPFTAYQSIAGAVTSAPAPDDPSFPGYIAETLEKLHTRFNKNMLVLFTANNMLSTVYQHLRNHPSVNKSNLLAQGMSGSRQILLEEFKKGSRMILLGTDSFWEGIDVPGEACEIVIIPRLPFPVPTHPLTQAIAQRMQQREGESFFSYSVPEAVIRLRQGAGRLIRTITDRGALIILDNRIVTRGYGKQFIRSLDGNFQTFADTDSMINEIETFFSSELPDTPPPSDITYVPLEDV